MGVLRDVRAAAVSAAEAWARKRVRAWIDSGAEEHKPVSLSARRWQSSETNRLNSGHWTGAAAIGSTINDDLAGELSTLRQRSTYEAANNPILEGVIATHTQDIVGARGPRLQVRSGNSAYDAALESVWSRWFAAPDITGKLSGPDLLAQWIRSLWTCGEYLGQIVTDTSAEGVQLRVHSLDPRRLDTPPGSAGDPSIVMGIRVDERGRPLSYWIEDRPVVLWSTSYTYTEVPAGDIIHEYRVHEAGQVRGVPWAAPCLQVIADLRDYDEQVLDAARMAADYAVYLYNTQPDAPYVEVNGSEEIERRQVTTLPPGWQPSQMKPEQPATVYAEYRAERLRELGRPVSMPLMMVMLDSSDHSYSSARFDGQLYNRTNEGLQAWIERRSLNRLLDLVEREAGLLGLLPTRPAGEISRQWTWPVPPHVDPQKEAQAEQIRLAIGVESRTNVCAARGLDYETVARQLVRESALRDEIGLSETGEIQEAVGEVTDSPIDDTQENQDEAEAAQAAEE